MGITVIYYNKVPPVRFELTRAFTHKILSLGSLPFPPWWQSGARGARTLIRYPSIEPKSIAYANSAIAP